LQKQVKIASQKPSSDIPTLKERTQNGEGFEKYRSKRNPLSEILLRILTVISEKVNKINNVPQNARRR